LPEDSTAKYNWNRKEVIKTMFQITLRAARVNVGLTRKEAAIKFNIHHETLTRYEYDSKNVPRSFFDQIESVYGIPTEHIYFGNEVEYAKAMTEQIFKEVKAMT